MQVCSFLWIVKLILHSRLSVTKLKFANKNSVFLIACFTIFCACHYSYLNLLLELSEEQFVSLPWDITIR
jgi:hypothetical protein